MENKELTVEDCMKESTPTEEKKNLLLLVCCAPCSSYCLEYLNNYFNITVLFYNPNISPESEYIKRLNELQKFVLQNTNIQHVEVIEVGYENDKYILITKGLEHEREGGTRCEKCFELRLDKAAEICKEGKFDYFTTTLTVSPHKNSILINRIGHEIAEKHKVCYLSSNFKKNDGYKKSIELSRKYNLYRQDYCGCVYSKIERDKKLQNNIKDCMKK